MFRSKKLPLAIRVVGLPIAATAMASTSTLAVAQEMRTLEEIVVTAQKREENLQDVPVAVSAFTGEQLQEAAIKDIFDLQTNTPGLHAGQNQTNTTSNFAIRGIGTAGQNFGLESSVGLYVDGVHQPRPSSMINDFVDMEAVEVLRGPQGTLFGKNTPAGAILFRTKAPRHYNEGFVALNAGNYGLRTASGAANLSLVEEVLAARLTGFSSQRDGYIDATIRNEDGTSSKTDINNRDRWGARFQLFYTPNDDISVRLIADKSEIDENCCGALTVLDSLESQAGEPGPSAILASLGGTVFTGAQFDDNETALNFAPTSRGEDSGISVEVNWDLSDSLTFTSITADREYLSYDFIDSDFGDVDILSLENDAAQSFFSQELRLDYESDRFKAVTGLFYSEQELDSSYVIADLADSNAYISQSLGLVPLIEGINALSPITGIPAAAPYITGYTPNHRASQQHESWAVFGQFDYSLSEALTLTMGLRYTEEDKKMQTVFSEWVGGEPWVWEGDLPNTGAAAALLPQLGAAYAAYLGGDAAPLGALLADPATAATLQPFSQAGWGNWLFANNAPRDDLDVNMSDDQVTGTLKLSYATSDDAMYYISYGNGYKSGGTNTDRIAQSFNPVFGPEKSAAWELGTKSTFLDQSLRLNLALHHTTLDDYQASTFIGDGFNLQNAGKLESYGAEAEAMWAVADYTTVNLAYAFTKARFKEFEKGNCWITSPWQTGATDPGQAQPGDSFCDRSGDRLASVPEHLLTLGLRQDFQLSGDLEAYVYGEYNYRSDIMTSNANDPLMEQEGYGLINARAGLTFLGMDANLTLWGRNLTDEHYTRTTFDAVIQNGTLMAYPGEPRTFGLSVNKNF